MITIPQTIDKFILRWFMPVYAQFSNALLGAARNLNYFSQNSKCNSFELYHRLVAMWKLQFINCGITFE